MEMKRAFDYVIAIGGLVFLAPFIGVLALAVLLTSGRPVLFRQVRVGRKERAFVMNKFRTMRILPGSEAGIFEPGNKGRITSFGKILRKTKLDELPQLWNVLKGDMSIVGPRPEVPKWVAAHPERWRRVLCLRPGITDPAALFYRDEETILASSTDPEKTYGETILPRKLAIYEAYMQGRTLGSDIRVILETLSRILVDIPGKEY